MAPYLQPAIRHVLAALALLGATALGAAADPLPAAPCPSVKDIAAVEVLAVYAGVGAVGPAGQTPEVKLRDAITLKVRNLDTLTSYEQCSPSHKKIVLFLDGRPLPNIRPYPPAQPDSGVQSFLLNRSEESRDTWTYLLGKPSLKPRTVAVSIGMEDGYAVTSSAAIRLDVIPTLWLTVWLIFFVLLLLFFLRLAARSEILRDNGPQPGGILRKPYSLARTQAAFWFFLIVASYLFIGLITGDYSSPITPTVLALMGISGGTAIGAAVIEQPPSGAVAPTAVSSKGHWWLDILSDEQGVNFHRFQMAVWTLVLGIVFMQQVYKNLAMPDFDNTLLGLLGISAGTYLGLKATSEPR